MRMLSRALSVSRSFCSMKARIRWPPPLPCPAIARLDVVLVDAVDDLGNHLVLQRIPTQLAVVAVPGKPLLVQRQGHGVHLGAHPGRSRSAEASTESGVSWVPGPSAKAKIFA